MTTARVRDLQKMRESNCEADQCQVIATIKFNCDEETFPLTQNILNEYPETYFASVLNHPWEDHESGLIRLSGDIVSFREIYGFMTDGECAILGDDVSLRFILDVKRDADFYGVVGLVPLCDQMAFLKLQNWCTKSLPSLNLLKDVHKQSTCSMWKVIESSLYPSLIQGEAIIPVHSTRRLLTRGPIMFPAHRRRYLADFCDGTKQKDLHSIMNQLPSFPHIKSYLAHPLVKVINEGEDFTDSFPVHLRGCVGAAYVILHAADGAVIAVNQNGQELKISKRGEYIVVVGGHSLNVTGVTSGRLVLLTGILKNDFLGETSKAVPDLPESIYSELRNAVQFDLQHFTGVALCLTTYYPIFEFDDELLCGEGSPIFLTDKDTFVYDYLAQHFVVTMVTVYIERQQAECRAGMLHSEMNHENVKFIVPPLGYGEVLDGRTRSDFRTLVTALYIQVK